MSILIETSDLSHSIPQSPPGPSRAQVGQMFDRIASRYDLLNRLLSGRRDVAWRKRLAKHLPGGGDLELLDLACGTADVLLTLYRECDRISFALGADLARGMLKLGQDKIKNSRALNQAELVQGNSMSLPLADDTFDVVTIAFGIRNFVDLPAALSEIRRVLRPGGKLLILEFSLPTGRIRRTLYLWYFRHVLPWLGGLISGDNSAYRYLNQTVETFPHGEDFAHVLRKAGFTDVSLEPLTGGIATIYDAALGEAI